MSVTATATVNHMFADRVAQTPDKAALRRKVSGTWEDVSWKGYRDAARKVGLGLRKLGLERGQPACILSETRAEWAFCDLGILGVGGVVVPIYHSNTAEEAEYILENSGARFVFAENLYQWSKLRERLDKLPQVEQVIIFDTSDHEVEGTAYTAQDHPFADHDKVTTFDAFLESAEGEDVAVFDEEAQKATPDDVLTIIYTSGTTGKPKGVVLTHRCINAEIEGLLDAVDLGPTDVTLAFLPLAHILARVLHLLQPRAGYTMAFAESIPMVVPNMAEVKPTFMAAVPRIFEKMHAKIMANVHAAGGLKTKLALWGLRNAMAADERARNQQGLGLGLSLKCKLGGGIVSKIEANFRTKLGNNIKFFVSGGAPLSPEIAAFFHTLHLPIYEGYGLSETTAATHINRPGGHKVGSVGRPVKGVECKLAPDNEILVKGDVVMREYYKRPEDTAEVLKDGWFHTGDIGEIDADGFLRITDRKKDIIVTAAGKNIAPQNVENHLKTHPLISQVAMFGDKKKFCVALISVDEEATRARLQEAGVEAPATTSELVALPQVQAWLDEAVKAKNAELPSYETIKYFKLLPQDFVVGDELTPTLKVRRKVVATKYATQIDALYSDHGA